MTLRFREAVLTMTERRLATETEAVIVFVVAFLARAVAVLAFPNVTIAHHMVIFGGPISDAAHWHQVAAEIALGEGIQTTMRPLYSLLLALPQPFFGHDVVIAKMVNALLDSGSILLGYFIFQRLFPAPAPLVIALSLAVLPNYIMFSHSLLSEHAGAFFLLAALVAMLSDNWHARWWALAGLLTGLSNLARPLSLFAIPFPIMAAFGFQRLRFIKPLAAFAIALCVTLAPWLLVQYQRHGIVSLSSNANQVLYAATSPKYQRWTFEVLTDKLAEGISPESSVKEWDRIYRKATLQNLRQWPMFWPRNIAVNLWESLNDGGLWLQQHSAFVVALALVWTLCGVWWAYRSGAPPGAPQRTPVLICAALVIAALGTGAWVLLLLAGTIFGALYSRRCAILVAIYLVGCLFGHSLFGFSSALDRLGLMYAPLVLGLQAAAFMSLGHAAGTLARMQWAPRLLTDRPATRQTAEASFQRPWVLRGALAAVTIVLFIACSRLAATYLWPRPPSISPYGVTQAEYLAVVDAMQKVRLDLAKRPAARGIDSDRLHVADFLFPLNYIHVPDALARTLGVRDPVYIAYIGFNRVGWRWSIVSGQDVSSMLGRRFVAVVADGVDPNRTIPELVYLGALSRVLALVPLTPQGASLEGLVLVE